MNKILLLIALIIAFTGCENKGPQITSKYGNLFSFYKDTNFRELLIYPDTAYMDSLYIFQGKEIDSATFDLLPKIATQGSYHMEGFYGIYSFPINNQYLGLLTRTPGEYSPTAISIWIYDLKSDSIINSQQLADNFGDAGITVVTSTILNVANEINALSSARTLVYSNLDADDNSPPDFASTNYALIKIIGGKTDTISTDSISLSQKFRHSFSKLQKFK